MYKAKVINAYGVGNPRKIPVSIQIYELRLYGQELGTSPYYRTRNNKENPITLAHISNGNSAPKWMNNCAKTINEKMNDKSVNEIIEFVDKYPRRKKL